MFSANRNFSGYPNQSLGGMPASATGERRGAKRARANNERGSAFIEFTLVMPVLLLVATGMAAFGLALHNDLVLTNAINGGAQLASFSRGQTTDPCATAYAAISSAAPSLTSGLSLKFVINGSTYTTNSCPAGAANMVQGATFQITGSYPYSLAVSGQTYGTHNLVAQVSEFIQ
jgi:Flp pilus assembly protein TadG